MAKEEESPKVTQNSESWRDESYSITHPSYGVVTVTHPQGGARKMFGSDLSHDAVVRIQFNYAEEERHLNSSWFYARGLVLEAEMTEAQWARFVASPGMGTPVPVTFRAVRSGEVKHLPFIKEQKTAREKASEEYKRKIDETVEKGEAVLAKLAELLAKGKASKKEIEDVIVLLNRSITRFKSDTTFSVDMFEEAMENLVEDAKIEIETHIMLTTQAIGAETLGIKFGSTLLENKGVDDEESV